MEKGQGLAGAASILVFFTVFFTMLGPLSEVDTGSTLMTTATYTVTTDAQFKSFGVPSLMVVTYNTSLHDVVDGKCTKLDIAIRNMGGGVVQGGIEIFIDSRDMSSDRYVGRNFYIFYALSSPYGDPTGREVAGSDIEITNKDVSKYDLLAGKWYILDVSMYSYTKSGKQIKKFNQVLVKCPS